jgi:hypothetical protein
MRWLALLLTFLAACAAPGPEELYAEGVAETRRLAELLAQIDTKDELVARMPKIKKSYSRMADLVLAVRKQNRRGGLQKLFQPSEASDALFAQLARLYEMPGCRALIEQAQAEAIQKLGHTP